MEQNTPLQPLPDHDPEQDWIDGHRNELTQQYPGEWIAVVGKTVIAHDPHVANLLRHSIQHRRPFVDFIRPLADQPGAPPT